MIELQKLEELTGLYEKQISDELSEGERIRLDELLADLPHFREIFEEAANDEIFLNQLSTYYVSAERFSAETVRSQYKKSLGLDNVIEMKPQKRSWLRYVAAAAVVLTVGFGIYFWQNSKQTTIADTGKEQQPKQQEIMPANGFAILVLADGRKVVLDSAGNGVIASNGGKDIIKEDGQISYQGQSKEVVYNTLVTSKGKVMKLPLADGSMVWLNAESSIHFPTEFPGNERVVEITGEVSFEVARNAKKPFRVVIKTPTGQKAEVAVLGTHFNVNAYSEEATIQTTLIEGKVKISELTNNTTRILLPGQQAAIDVTGDMKVLDNVNLDAVVAWKNNDFFFKNNDIKTIMRQLARWYDITVSYQSDLPGRSFSGQISRKRSLSDVLELLKKANVRFSISGRQVTVLQ